MKKILSAVVLANPKKPYARALKKRVISFLKSKNVILRKDEGDIIITIGGDGTILYNKEYYRSPFFGIGTSTSFLCQALSTNWKSKLAKVLKGRYNLDKRMMLAGTMDGRKLRDSLNEICIRTKEHRLLSARLIAGRKKYEFLADGVIFSTPTGSSAYSYSCGGKQLPAHAKKYGITAIAPYRRMFSPISLPESFASTLYAKTECDTDVIVDGQFIYPVRGGKTTLKIRKSKREFFFISV